jgi:hypothetical protein
MEEQVENKRHQSRGWLGVLVFAAAVLAAGLLLYQDSGLVVRNEGTFQAVFLDNNQVYFGRLEEVNQDFWSLTDIYYLRTGGTVQQGGAVSPSQIDLIKLGAELHAPTDEMIIGKEHVVFYEEIGEDSEIMKLIRQHKDREAN